MRIALFNPNIPQNMGTILRMGACLDIYIDIIGPTSFLMSDKKLMRAGMDYLDLARYTYHTDWQEFEQHSQGSRIILVTTKTDQSFQDFQYQDNDILLFGSESHGVPAEIHAGIEHKITIPMNPEARSLNLAISTAIISTEAKRQLNLW